MARDLRTFLAEYERHHPEQVVHVEKEVSSKYEVTAFIRAFEKQNKYPIMIFHRVRNERGDIAAWPVITNLCATRSRNAEAIGVSPREVARAVVRLSRAEARKPVVVSRQQAPCKDVVRKVPQELSLFDLPAIRQHALDGGPFFSAGFLTVIDPDTGIDNCALIRGNIWEDDRTGVGAYSPHTTLIYRKYEERREDMRAVYWLGHHPAGILGAQMKLDFPQSHYESMGGLLGEPLRLVPSETLGDDFLVPADAEFIVEGIVPALKREPEGPFGEYARYFGPQRWNPYMKVTCITHRRDAMFHNLCAAGPEHFMTGAFGIEAIAYESIKRVVPGVQNVCMPMSGCSRFHLYVQIKKQKASDGRDAILTGILADPRIKHVFAVDDDVDIFDEKHVLWAVATRSQWDRDLIVVPDLTGGLRDPSAGDPRSAKGGIDATKPLAKDMVFPLENYLPAEITEKISVERPNEYIPDDVVARVPTGEL
jgi:UbiD family decarboxylase